MDGILRQQFEFIERLIEREGTVGIEPQLYLMEREPFADTFHQIQFLVEVDGPNLQFHTVETFLQLLLHALQHLFVVAHPHQTVDGDTLFTATEGIVEQPFSALEMQESRLESKAHRGIVAKCLIVEYTCMTKRRTETVEHLRIARYGITTEIRERCTLAHACALTLRQRHEPTGACGVNATRRASRLFEMERTLLNAIGHGNLGYFLKSGLRFSRKALPPSCASSRK